MKLLAQQKKKKLYFNICSLLAAIGPIAKTSYNFKS